MSVSTAFSGLPIETLVGAPLNAACAAQNALADATLEFVQRIAFGEEGTGDMQIARFNIVRGSETLSIEVPLLVILNVPSLVINSVHIDFTMTVKSSQKVTSAFKVGVKASARFGFVKVNASVSYNRNTSRESSQQATYNFSVDAAQQVPPGLTTVLSIMEKFILDPTESENDAAPTTVASPTVP